MAVATNAVYQIEFVINDPARDYPTETVDVPVPPEAIHALINDGYLVLRHLLDHADAGTLADAVSHLADVEMGQPAAELLAGQNIYLRSILDKDQAFHRLLGLRAPLLISRAVLGPHVWLDAEARMTFAGVAEISVPWHNHIPVIPDPQPAFFCYPHQIHCLVYLDPVGIDEGLLHVLPRSHRDPSVRIKMGESVDIPGQVAFRFQPGDAILMHGNLWHRVGTTTAAAGNRRLLLMGYVPSWVRGDNAHGVPAERPLGRELRRSADPELRELLGDFTW